MGVLGVAAADFGGERVNSPREDDMADEGGAARPLPETVGIGDAGRRRARRTKLRAGKEAVYGRAWTAPAAAVHAEASVYLRHATELCSCEP